MAHVTRRGLLMRGGLALGVAAAGTPLLAAPTALADGYEPSLQTRRIDGLGDPAPFVTIPALGSGNVMQDVVYVPSTRTFFTTQAVPGSNGSAKPYETTVISRVRRSDAAVLDSMRIVDGGHGLGFEAEAVGDDHYIWMTWMGRSTSGSENDFVRFRYQPGSWTRSDADGRLDLDVVPLQDNTPEAVYHFDWGRGWAVERHFNWPGGSDAPSETFTRRKIADLRRGADRAYGRMTLAASPPTTQGFATMGDTFFRWQGAPVIGDAMDPNDPVRLQQFDWGSGALVAQRTYTISQSSPGHWDGGRIEPQGLSVFRESDGTASLILGDSTGGPGDHTYHVTRFDSIGAA